MHIFGFNVDADAHNQKKLNEIANEDEKARICASDDQYDSTGAIDVYELRTSRRGTRTRERETVLLLSVNAWVMMTVNADTSDGLVDGVMGKVSHKGHNKTEQERAQINRTHGQWQYTSAKD